MPRPTRKPKRFNPSNAESNPTDAPVISTPLYSKQSTTNPPLLASPELSPIQHEKEFTIYADKDKSNIPEQGTIWDLEQSKESRRLLFRFKLIPMMQVMMRMTFL